MSNTDDEALLLKLRDPRITLKNFGTIVDQETGERIGFDPNKIAPELQNDILNFVGEAPRMESGHKKWKVILASRQTGKSVCTALSGYCRVAYTPGIYGAVIADNRERSIDLFRNINQMHEYMPDDIRMPTIPNRESRQLTFMHGGTIRTLSAQSSPYVGIGRAIDMLHASEVPFWANAAGVFSGIIPAFVNRKEATIICESTPASMSAPSAAYFRDMCAEARKGIGRWEFSFHPFFTSKLNERPWNPTDRLTNEEVGLLDRFGGECISGSGLPYLTIENLSFRRALMGLDPEIRRNPNLFWVYYPVDPISCWAEVGGGVVPAHALEKHQKGVLQEWAPDQKGYQEYVAPRPGAQYIIGVDPCGWMGGDPASIQVLEVWEDRWEQAAVMNNNMIDPPRLAQFIIHLARKYNDALVVIENNGVGLGVLSPLVTAMEAGEIRNLYYNQRGVKTAPGIAATSKSINAGLGYLIDALMDTLIIHDQETVDQLATYRHDKLTDISDVAKLLSPDKVGRGRRARHHWDRCSALMWACLGARELPVRFRPKAAREQHGELFNADRSLWSVEQQYAAQKAEKKARKGLRKGEDRIKRPRRKHWAGQT